MPLISTHNPLLHEVRQAAKSGRPMADGLIVAEGPHLLAEALRSMWAVEQVLCTLEAQQAFPELLADAQAPIIEVAARAFASIATTENAPGLVALLRPREWSWNDLITTMALIIILDAVQDPGNVGTIARSAEAFGASGILLVKGCARVSNGKVLRAAAGSLFRLPYLEQLPQEEIVERLCAEKLPVYVLTADGGVSLIDSHLDSPCALVVGNEGAGVSPAFRGTADRVCIPTLAVESLNVGVAASVALYEAARQRRQR